MHLSYKFLAFVVVLVVLIQVDDIDMSIIIIMFLEINLYTGGESKERDNNNMNARFVCADEAHTMRFPPASTLNNKENALT